MINIRRILSLVWLSLMAWTVGFSQAPSSSKVLDDLRSPDSAVRLEGARGLPKIWQTFPDRTTLVGQLIPLLSSSDEHVRLSVLATFEQICIAHPEDTATIIRAKSALIKATDDPLEEVRQYATAVLGIALPPSDPDLRRLVLRGLADPSHKVRRVAIGAVSFKKLNDPEIVAALASPSSSPGELSQRINTLGEVAPTTPKAIRFFVDSLSDNTSDVKSQALRALSKSGKAAAEALPKLRQLAADPHESEQVKGLVSEAIRKIE
jgi:HEAT repeat protein